MNRITPAVRILIIINIAVFLLNSAIRVATPYDMTELFGLYIPANEKYAIWQYLTGMFMHHGVMHLTFNMAGLFFFGCALERALGHQRFLILYLLAGIGSGIIYTLIQSYEYSAGIAVVNAIEALQSNGQTLSGNEIYQNTIYKLSRMYRTEVVGASGALYGVIVALAMRFPNAKMSFRFIPFPVVAKYFVLGLVSLELVLQLTDYSTFGRFVIAHSAHLGGALTGFVVMLYWRLRD